jgi:hypothetical protein
MHGGAEACDEMVLLASGEVGEEWIVIKFDGLEVVVLIPTVASLLQCGGAVGDCSEGGNF